MLTAAVAFLGFVVGTLVGAAYDYPIALALGCGALAVGWVVVLNLPAGVPFVVRLLVIVALALGLGVISRAAAAEGLASSAPFLVLLVTLAVQGATFAALRRWGQANPEA